MNTTRANLTKNRDRKRGRRRRLKKAANSSIKLIHLLKKERQRGSKDDCYENIIVKLYAGQPSFVGESKKEPNTHKMLERLLS